MADTPDVSLQPIPKLKPESREGSTLAIFSGVACLAIGLWLGRYTGAYPLIPLMMAVIIGWPFAKLSKGKRKALAITFAFHAGQLAWVFWYVSFIRMPNGAMPDGSWSFFFDLILLTVGTLWIIVAPSLFIVLSLSGYQVVWLIVNLIQRSNYGELPIDSWPATSLSVQIILRLACLTALALALRTMQKMHDENKQANPMATN